MELSDLRAAAMERAGHFCEWPDCRHQGSGPPLEMAHLDHRGMGGYEAANTLDNVAILCRYHHDLLDGRTALAGRRAAVADLLGRYLRMSRRFVLDGDEDDRPLCFDCGHDYHGSHHCRQVVPDVSGEGGDNCGCGPIRKGRS